MTTNSTLTIKVPGQQDTVLNKSDVEKFGTTDRRKIPFINFTARKTVCNPKQNSFKTWKRTQENNSKRYWDKETSEREKLRLQKQTDTSSQTYQIMTTRRRPWTQARPKQHRTNTIASSTSTNPHNSPAQTRPPSVRAPGLRRKQKATGTPTTSTSSIHPTMKNHPSNDTQRVSHHTPRQKHQWLTLQLQPHAAPYPSPRPATTTSALHWRQHRRTKLTWPTPVTTRQGKTTKTTSGTSSLPSSNPSTCLSQKQQIQKLCMSES